MVLCDMIFCFFFQAEDGIRDIGVTGVQTCALPICTNWAQFSRLTGGVIGQPLAMEGTFSFFLESAFLGLFLYGEKRLGKWGHWWRSEERRVGKEGRSRWAPYH